jgi:hypothetical protein
MFTAYVVVGVLAAGLNTAAATVDFLRADWVLTNMTRYGVSHAWLSTLGALKAAGAVGLLAGIAVPLIGIAASVGLVVYFAGAVFTVVRARWVSHLPYPTVFLLLGAASSSSRSL